jgi:hypothetical protein
MKGKNIELKSAFVSANSSHDNTAARDWRIELMPGAKPRVIHPGECIAFGQSIDGYRRNGKLRAFEEGETYGFGIRRNDKPNDWVSRLYAGLFCVSRASDGRIVYLPYVYRSNGTITYPSCGRYAGLPAAADGFNPPRPASSYPIGSKP